MPRVWVWDLDRIRAKGYSDNVVDLMVGKLRRLSDTTQSRSPATRLSRERGRDRDAEYGLRTI